MPQKTQSSAAAGGPAAVATYSLRHPAQRRSSDTSGDEVLGDLGREAGDEVVDPHAPLDVALPVVDPDGAVGDVVVPHHQDVRQLLELGLADAAAERLGR